MYNFVFFQNPNDYYRVAFSEAETLPNVSVNYGLSLKNRVAQGLYKIHFSDKINKVIPLPFKSLWNPLYYSNTFIESTDPICFVYNGGILRAVLSGLVEYLKKEYVGSKHVCFLQDIVSSYPPEYENAFGVFDLVISYDFSDVSKYNFLYHPTVYTVIDIPETDAIEKSDVYFLGAAKDRLEEIYNVYDMFVEAKKKCDFNITGVPSNKQRYEDGLHYINHLTYLENLQHVMKTKSIVDIAQGNSSGYTLRAWEAIYYSKLFFSNNPNVEEIKKNSRGVFTLNSSLDINSAFCVEPLYDKIWRTETSIHHLLSFIESNL